jgi:DUF971 family protein
MQEQTIPPSKKERDGVVVWDQHGLVVLWPDGYSSRFSWDTLRHLSLCRDCQTQTGQEDTASKHFP